ncbi:MAG: TolC family protein [Planctomycetota bacterium]|nr:TolC family protein [Planctomycetota bacterium]
MSSIWGRNEQVQNNRFLSGGLQPGKTLVEETGVFSAELRKDLRSGGQLALVHDWNYNESNRTDLLFPSVFNGSLRGEFRQPLLAGTGFQYTDTAGPVSSNLIGVSGVSQGVVIAAINTDISFLDFELGVARMLREIETLYWQLYQSYDALTRASADLVVLEKTRGNIKSRVAAQAPGGGTAEISEIKTMAFRATIERNDALDAVLSIEAQLRRLMGLTVDGSVVIQPTSKPIGAELIVDWDAAVATALDSRAELRRQSMQVRSLELQLSAAESLKKPRLDLVASYRVNGFGDHLIRDTDFDGLTAEGFNSAYRTLFQGDHTGWELGFQFAMPLGARLADTRIRHLQLRVAAARAILREQEVEITHELAAAYRELDRAWQGVEFGEQRLGATRQHAKALETQFQVAGDTQTLMLLTRAQLAVVEAEGARLASSVQHTEAQADLNYRMGAMLRLNNIQLADDHCHIAWIVSTPRSETVEVAVEDSGSTR